MGTALGDGLTLCSIAASRRLDVVLRTGRLDVPDLLQVQGQWQNSLQLSKMLGQHPDVAPGSPT